MKSSQQSTTQEQAISYLVAMAEAISQMPELEEIRRREAQQDQEKEEEECQV